MDRIPLLPRRRFDSNLLEIRDLTPSVKEFVFSTSSDFDFYAGQFITLKFQVEGRTIGRPYSIASPPQLRGKVEVCIKLVEGGLVTPRMFTEPEPVMDLSGPMGRFFLHPKHKEQDLVFIGTGTGIAPLKSMIQDLYHSGFNKKITVLAGVRHMVEILYKDLWVYLEKTHPGFRHVQMISRPESATAQDLSFHEGRVGDYLPKLIEGEQVFVICGLKEMINSVTEILRSKGIPEERILYEKYD